MNDSVDGWGREPDWFDPWSQERPEQEKPKEEARTEADDLVAGPATLPEDIGVVEDAGDPPDAESASRGRILVLEDDPEAQLLAEQAARHVVREVRLASTMEEGRRELENEDFDVVILDLLLPDGDGRQLLAEIREQPRSAQTQVMVLSGKTGRYTKLECFRLGADEFLEKPVDPEVLEAAVGRQVERARTRAAETRVDHLTGLANRAGLIERFPELRAMSKRTRAPLTVALVEILDLDRVGRERGRAGVDRVQAGTAQILSEAFHEPDIVGRWEYGLFVVLLPGTEPVDAVKPLRHALDRVLFHVTPDEASEAPEVVAGVVSGLRFEDLREAVLEAERALSGIRREEGEAVVIHPTDVEEPQKEEFRILMVEDDEVSAHLVQHRLQRSGMEVVHLTSGSAAEDLIQTSSPGDFDIALFDVKLPGADGFELLQKVRETPGWKDFPVIMVTSMGQESDVVRAFELGADDYILKPLSPRELLARVQRLLRRR